MTEKESLLKELESASAGTSVALSRALDALKFNADGLLPAIAQESTSRDVLMLAWVDREALERSLRDGYAWYYSRSRQSYWRKGDTSGHVQKLVSLRIDCDGDTVLYEVEQTGAACHTHRAGCFYLEVDGDRVTVISSTPEA